jgi:hypothetical protein
MSYRAHEPLMKTTALTTRTIALAELIIAALVFTPSAAADVPGLAPFAREWDGMRESVVIDPTGHGRFRYMNWAACPKCSMADVPYATMDFTLTSVSAGTASGTITASPDPQTYSVAEPVAATLAPQQWGDTIRWAVGDNQLGLFCGSNTAMCGY